MPGPSDSSRLLSAQAQGSLGVREPGADVVMGAGSIESLLSALRSGQLGAEQLLQLLQLLFAGGLGGGGGLPQGVGGGSPIEQAFLSGGRL